MLRIQIHAAIFQCCIPNFVVVGCWLLFLLGLLFLLAGCWFLDVLRLFSSSWICENDCKHSQCQRVETHAERGLQLSPSQSDNAPPSRNAFSDAAQRRSRHCIRFELGRTAWQNRQRMHILQIAIVPGRFRRRDRAHDRSP